MDWNCPIRIGIMRIAWIWTAPAWLAVPILAAAQIVAPAPRPSLLADLSGVVLNDATGTPIRRAAVTLLTLDAMPLEALTFSE